jgi:hypothetical protein
LSSTVCSQLGLSIASEIPPLAYSNYAIGARGSGGAKLLTCAHFVRPLARCSRGVLGQGSLDVGRKACT